MDPSIDPPDALVRDDVQTAEANYHARRLASGNIKRRFGKDNGATPFSKSRSSKSPKVKGKLTQASPSEANQANTDEAESQTIDVPSIEERIDSDIKRLAVVYENQRGIMILGTPRYSSQSLLPMDPPAFSVPSPKRSDTSHQRVRGHKKKQPNVSLEEFPLPDENWQWLDDRWMIDMRHRNVQYDGYEYNWIFRARKWKPQASFINLGGLVRRRRWVREMIRLRDGRGDSDDPVDPSALPSVKRRKSLIFSEVDAVWKGDSDDWQRYHDLSKRLRDARKMDIWKHWLSTRPFEETKDLSECLLLGSSEVQSKASSDAGQARQSADPFKLSAVGKVLRYHGSEIALSFVYNTYRLAFFDILVNVGLLKSVPSRSEWNSDTFWLQSS